MLVLVFILPLIAVLLCLVLNRAVATRWLGLTTGAALLLCGAAVLVERVRAGLPIALLDNTWIAVENQRIAIVLRLDAANWALALLVLAGGGLALLVLATALPRNLRGFGGLFAAAATALLAITAGLTNQTLLFLPVLWATAALLTFLALRASGALSKSDAPAIVLLAGLWTALMLMGTAVLEPLALPGTITAHILLGFWVLVGLLALGGPPFHTPFQDLAEAPAALVGALLPLGLPLLGGYSLIRFFATHAIPLPAGWRLALTLLGLLTLIACASAAAGTTRLRPLIGWQFSAQMGLLLVAIGQGGIVLTLAAPALLAGGALAALACYLAAAVLERRTGTDDLAALPLREPLMIPGAVFLIGAAASVGLPGTWGLWPRRWLIDELLRTAPWTIAPLLAGSALLALAWAAPVAAFWRHSGAPTQEPAVPVRSLPLGAITATTAVSAIIVILGVFPQLAWAGWLAPAQGVLAPSASVPSPALPGATEQIISGAAALALLGLTALARARRRCQPSEAPPAGVLLPQALSESLRGAAWLASPDTAFARLWDWLIAASQGIRRVLSLFEQRYYLAGLLIAVIVVIMLFIQ